MLVALNPRYALEDEIARLIDVAAERAAQKLIDEWEHPDDDSADLFDRAVRAHYHTLRRQLQAESVATAQQFRSDL